MVTVDNFFAYSLAGGAGTGTGTGSGTGSGSGSGGGNNPPQLLATNLPPFALQTELQAYYDGQAGADAPDTVPQEVIDVASASGFVVYLGHNIWSFNQNGAGWTVFGNGSKSGVGNVTIAELYTYKA